MSTFKTAVVGCGGIGKAHGKAWKNVAELTAVVDLNPEKAKEAGEMLGVAWYTSIDDLPQVDAVSVATPPQAHYGVTKALLMRDMHVFCEKPMTVVPEEGYELAEISRARGLQLGVGFKMRHEPIFKAAREYLPEIGNIISVVTTKQQEFNPRPEGAWVKKTGAMYELSIHDFDLIGYITGHWPEKVLYSKLSHRFGWEAEDAFHIVADCGGFTANLQGMYATSCIFAFKDLTITIMGENGYMRIERPDRIVMHTDTHRVIEVDPKGVNSFEAELTHFRDACLGLEENTVTPERAAALTEFIETARRMSV